jgi:hypothetical protein
MWYYVLLAHVHQSKKHHSAFDRQIGAGYVFDNLAGLFVF